MWKKTLCMAVVGLGLAVSAQAQSYVAGTIWTYPNYVVAVGQGTGGVYLVLGEGNGSAGGLIAVADSNSVPNALDIGLAAMNAGKPIGAYLQQIFTPGPNPHVPQPYQYRIIFLFVSTPNFSPSSP